MWISALMHIWINQPFEGFFVFSSVVFSWIKIYKNVDIYYNKPALENRNFD